MRQVSVREPWVGHAYTSDQQLLDDLMARVQILETRLRNLEEQVKRERKAEQLTVLTY